MWNLLDTFAFASLSVNFLQFLLQITDAVAVPLFQSLHRAPFYLPLFPHPLRSHRPPHPTIPFINISILTTDSQYPDHRPKTPRKSLLRPEKFPQHRLPRKHRRAQPFRQPKKLIYSHNTIANASVGGTACPQATRGVFFASTPASMLENCLTLRVDPIAITAARYRLPVMIRLYGGSFAVAQICDPNYNPTGLLEAHGSPIRYAVSSTLPPFLAVSVMLSNTV